MVRNLGCIAALALASCLQTALAADPGTYDDDRGLRSEINALRQDIQHGMTTGYEDKKAPAKVEAAPPAAVDHSGCGYDGGCCPAQCGCSCGGCSCGTCGCFEPCCHSQGLWATAELMFFRYHRADGVRVGDDAPVENVEFDFEATVRLTLGWVSSSGLGARVRWWEFDQNAAGVEPRDNLGVDTYNLDVEVFDTFCLNRNWDLELSAGIRYNHFIEQATDANAFRTNVFHGYGGILGAEVRRLVCCNHVLWARGRLAILMDDKIVSNQAFDPRLTDVVVAQTELAFGYNYIVPLCDNSYVFAGVAAEWQLWSNFSSSYDGMAFGGAEDRFDGQSDVGFGGFGIQAGLVR